MLFLVVLCLSGVAASFCLSWVGVTVIGLVASPFYALAMMHSGVSTMAACGYALAGFGLLQVGFALGGLVTSVLTGTTARGSARHGLSVAPESLLASRSGNRLDDPEKSRSIGTYLPLVVTCKPPCHADGSPWDGVEDPGYRTRLLVFAWLGRGVSVAIGRPVRTETASVRAASDTRASSNVTSSDGGLASHHSATSDQTRESGG